MSAYDQNRWSIYVLKEPETKGGAVRYVGMTHHIKPEQRLCEHLSVARINTSKDHRSNWIRSLMRVGEIPQFEVIHTGDGDGWKKSEMEWISFFREIGCVLVNSTEGGEGTLGWKAPEEFRRAAAERMKKRDTGKKYPKEHCEKLSVAQKAAAEERRRLGTQKKVGRTPEWTAKLAASQRGRKLSPETIAKMVKGRENPSEEARQKWRDAIAKRPPEQQQAFVISAVGAKRTDEHKKILSESKKAYWEKWREEHGRTGQYDAKIHRDRSKDREARRVRDKLKAQKSQSDNDPDVTGNEEKKKGKDS